MSKRNGSTTSASTIELKQQQQPPQRKPLSHNDFPIAATSTSAVQTKTVAQLQADSLVRHQITYSPYEDEDRKVENVGVYWKESTMRGWYAAMGTIMLLLGVSVFLYLLCYRIGGALPWSPVSYSALISSNFPSVGFQESRWNILLAYTVVIIFVGIAYLCALIRPCFRGIANGAWRHGINGFRTIIAIINDPMNLFFVMQIAIMKDVIAIYYAVLAAQMAHIGFLYLFEKENSTYLAVVRRADLYGEQRKFEEQKQVDNEELRRLATHWTAYLFSWVMLIVKWVPILTYMIFSAIAVTTASPRDWVVIAGPVVGFVFDVLLQIGIGIRYSRERYGMNIALAKTENWEVIACVMRTIQNVFFIIAALVPAAQGF
jgi:hypothetical protein